MYIDKAIKRQIKFKKRFYTTMILLSILLPTILYLLNIRSRFIYGYLIILEILIFLAVLRRIDFYRLVFSCSNNKLKVRSGLFSKETIIICDKVAIVHTSDIKDNMDIIIISSIRYRTKLLKKIDKSFLQSYTEINQEYLKLKRLNPDQNYYFQIIRKGALNKYILLETIYKNCVKATYTTAAIDNIKIARKQNEF